MDDISDTNFATAPVSYINEPQAPEPKRKRELVEPDFPRKLLGGYAHFRKNRLSRERERYEELAAKGQRPETMVIACCDSRAAPETVFGTAPGEIFVVRNVANIVPPFIDSEHVHSTSAALEYAVQELRVRHIVVMGHGRCGGIAAVAQQMTGGGGKPLSPGNFIGKWIALLDPVAAKIERHEGDTAADLQFKLEAEGIRNSLQNLKSFPCVSTLLEREQISLHGAWFDISDGELWTLNHETDEFEKPFG